MGELGKKIGWAATAAGFGFGGYWLGRKLALTRRLTVGLLGGMALFYGTYITFKEVVPKGMDVWKESKINERVMESEKIMYDFRKDSLEKTIKYNLIREGKIPVDPQSILNKIDESQQGVEQRYKKLIRDNEQKYQDMLQKNDSKYNNTMKDILEQNRELSKKIDELKLQKNTSYLAPNTSKNLEGIASNANSQVNIAKGSASLDYYLIDADKSQREINVLAVYDDGSEMSLGITSKASFAKNGGPADDIYNLSNQGSRTGDLYPVFFKMNGVIGISGAGDHNQHLSEIEQGALANRTGIRVKNDVCLKISDLLNSGKKTVVNVHE